MLKLRLEMICMQMSWRVSGETVCCPELSPLLCQVLNFFRFVQRRLLVALGVSWADRDSESCESVLLQAVMIQDS